MPDLTTQPLNARLAAFNVGSIAIDTEGAEVVIVAHSVSMIDGKLAPRIKVLGLNTGATAAQGLVGRIWEVALDELAYNLVGNIFVGYTATTLGQGAAATP